MTSSTNLPDKQADGGRNTNKPVPSLQRPKKSDPAEEDAGDRDSSAVREGNLATSKDKATG